TLLTQFRAVMEQVATDPGPATWATVLEPLEAAGDALENAWSPISHLANVQDTPELRTVYRAGVQLITDFDTEYKQHPGLFARYEALRDSADYAVLTTAQQAALAHALRDGQLAGIALPPAQQAHYKALASDLSALTTQYSENVLDATQGWSYLIRDEQELAGLPDSARSTLAANARQADQVGWLVNLEFPSYMPVMLYAENRALRQRLHEAFTTRASDQGPNAGQWDNAPVMADIMDKRQQSARLLGFANYAELSLATKMADSPDTVQAFLRDLAEQALPQGREEFAQLQSFAQQTLGLEKLEPWDINFASERLKQASYAISDEALRPYFPVPRVLSGLFETVHRLYGLTIEPVADVDRYHPDVQLFNVVDQGRTIARFYLDLYARSSKRGGAWMDVCRTRRRSDSALQLPVAYLNCNFTASREGKPSLLTHEEVTTLFHEFGHGLHHMLTEVDVGSVSGIAGVAWDAVELPSQFMENFCWEPAALAFISGHVDTGEPLPETLLAKMLAARNFQAAMQLLRQIEFSLFDFELHQYYEEGQAQQITDTLSRIRAEVAVVPVAPYGRFENSFSHIFAGGYAAGYYSYKWAEVLSADAFSRFEEEGVFAAAPAQAFRRHILASGGSVPAAELFHAFRGREPDITPLLRHSGIRTAA
ncbi:MAG: M3 family metallopeptidase, partial [Natronospirillum sp.]